MEFLGYKTDSLMYICVLQGGLSFEKGMYDWKGGSVIKALDAKPHGLSLISSTSVKVERED